jgi:hypothetical protein
MNVLIYLPELMEETEFLIGIHEQLLKSHVFSERELQGRLSYWAYPLKDRLYKF